MYPSTFKQACKITGDDPTAIRFTQGTQDGIAFEKLKVTTKSINMIDNDGKEWIPDWSSYDRKWRPWWDLEKSSSNAAGFRFFGPVFGRTGAFAPVGLCFKTENGLKHSVKKFFSDWKIYIKGN